MSVLVNGVPLSAASFGSRILSRRALVGTAAAGAALSVVIGFLAGWSDSETGVLAALLAFATVTATSWYVEGRRRAIDRMMANLMWSAFGVALIPLGLVLYFTFARGVVHYSYQFFTHSLAGVPPSQAGGGIYAAIIGTAEQVGIASLVSVPTGILVAVYIQEFGRGWLARLIRFFVDVMTGIPSIVAGLFLYSFLVIGLHQGFSGFAAALALSILMLPIVIRSAEEMLALVPNSLREASYALGVARWRTILSVVLPTASAGLTTGVMLAVARVTGETAPLLLTAFDYNYVNYNPFHGQQSALSLIVYDQAQQAYQPAIDRAWASAATLILIVVILYVGARVLTRRNVLRRG